MRKLLVFTMGLCLGAPLFADGHATGDAAAGEKVFGKCKACHMIKGADGAMIVKGGKTGPNLYGIFARQAGSFDGFRYGKSIVAAGEAGLAWNEADFVEYVTDSKKFLRAYLDDSRAKSRMAFKLRKEADRANVWAYLVSVGPAVAAEVEAETDN